MRAIIHPRAPDQKIQSELIGNYEKPRIKSRGDNITEYHQHPTTEFYDLSIGSNTKEPLLIIITTAGKDLSYPCYREYEFCAQVLDPDIDVYDEEYLIDIVEQDKEEVENPKLLLDSKLWLKSNPIRASYTAGIENIRTTYQKALKVPEDLPSVLTKNFNIWVQAKENGYMDMTKFKLCEVDAYPCLLYTSPSPRDLSTSRMPSSA